MSALTYRVGTEGNTPKAVGLIEKDFGVNINQFGRYTPAQVNALSRLAKETKMQAKLAKQALAALSEIAKYKVEIERYRKEAIDLGLSAKEEQDKYVLAAILRTHGHDAHIKKMFQEMTNGMKLIDAQSQSQLSLGQSGFQNKLREIQARHQSALQGQSESLRESLSDIRSQARDRKVESRRNQSFMKYIRADGYQPSGSGGGGFLSGWFR